MINQYHKSEMAYLGNEADTLQTILVFRNQILENNTQNPEIITPKYITVIKKFTMGYSNR